MTETEAPPPDDQAPDAVESRQVDLLDQLTIGEIDVGSRELGSSLVGQITGRGDRYEKALAVVLWLHRRRTDRRTEPRAMLAELTQLRFVELQTQLTDLATSLATEVDSDPLASRSG